MRLMALDVGIGDGSSLTPVQGEPSLWMEDEAPYWFLHPLFEKLAAETGQYIDLYGEASFAGEQLIALKKMLTEARRLTEAQPHSWEVCVGYSVVPTAWSATWRRAALSYRGREELRQPLDKGTLLNLIIAWERVVARAEELGLPVVCLGD